MISPIKHNSPKYEYIFSVCLISIGAISMGYSFMMHPFLVPLYGGGEQFYLEDYNNNESQFPFYANTRLNIIMNANDTVQISINDEHMFTGTFYEVDIDPNIDVVITLKSNSPVNGSFTLRQEIPLYMAVFSIGCLLMGVLSIFLNWYITSKRKPAIFP